MRTRLRSAYPAEVLADLYAVPNRSDDFADHALRVQETVRVGNELVDAELLVSGADLSCGDAKIATALHLGSLQLGDLAPGYPICGPIEDTVSIIKPVDLFVCCETVEHLDNPDAVLAQVRAKTRFLLLSTPIIGEGDDDSGNWEHYWAFDEDGLRETAEYAGFRALSFTTVPTPSYTWQIWTMS